MSSDPKVIVALDFPDAKSALTLTRHLDPSLCRVKVGKELFTAEGPALVRQLVEQEFDVFLDLKFHDIPVTVAKACRVAADLGVWMLNVHALGGEKMMSAALDAVHNVEKPPLLIAVTILTSMDQVAINQVGLLSDIDEQVSRLALLAKQSGLAGVVCSAMEAKMLRQQLGDEFALVTPGIRPIGSAKNDQTRIVTPAEAMRLGASYLVIGRPITGADDPLTALEAINSEIANIR